MEGIDYSTTQVAVAEPDDHRGNRERIGQVLCDGPTAEMVRWTSWRVCRSLGLGTADHEEICQELRADLARRATGYSRERGPWAVFARLVLSHRAAVLYRRFARARFIRPESNLLTRGHARLSFDEFLSTKELYDSSCQIDLQLDLRDTIATLPAPLPEVCRLIQIGHSATDVSRLMSVPRSTVRSWMQRIQRKFIDRNLDKYL